MLLLYRKSGRGIIPHAHPLKLPTPKGIFPLANLLFKRYPERKSLAMRPIALQLMVWLLLASCSEEFPEYVEPTNVLTGSIVFTSPDTIEVVYEPLFDLYYFNSPMTFRVEVLNQHDDILQGTARISGLITVQSFSEAPRVFQIPLISGNLNQPPVFQGNIAISPGQMAVFSTSWLPYDIYDQIVFDGLPFIQDGPAKFYGPIPFGTTATVQIFERVPLIECGDLQFSLVFRVVNA